jgi:hypothetical protein
MLTAKFLKSLTAARHHEEYRSKLLDRHAAARAIATTPAEPESISPMTIALVSVADLRATSAEVSPISGLLVADVEPTVQWGLRRSLKPG